MHRSGTSLLGGVLQRLGVALPGETIAGDRHNPEGYFEWDAVVDIQERLLIDLERWWPAQEGASALPEGWLQHPATRQAYYLLRSLVKDALDQQQGVWAIKDPRCSRLLPLWLELASEFSIPLRLLLSVRDPAAVVTSLERRDGPLTGMDLTRAQQLWWRHNLEAIDVARDAGLPLTVVDFDRWFSAPEDQLDHMLKALPELDPSAFQRQKALALINPKHRRSLRPEQEPRLKPCVHRLYRRLLRHPLPQRLPSARPPFSKKPASGKEQLTLQLDRPTDWPVWLLDHRHYPAPRLTTPACLAAECHISVCGDSWRELLPHLLLQRLPFPSLRQSSIDFEQSGPHNLQVQVPTDELEASGDVVKRLALNLELPPPERASHWLSHLHLQHLIFDPEPARVLLMRALGLPAWWLDSTLETNGWLQQPQAVDPRLWAARLGLTSPQSGHLVVLGSAGAEFERALTREAALGEQANGPAISYCPGWPELLIEDFAAGLLRAGWLQAAASCSARLVHAGDDDCPPEWALLKSLTPSHAHPQNASPAELRAFHAGQPLMALAEDRPKPPSTIVRQWQADDLVDRPPLAAVLVSLYNYADRITEALQSVRAQTQPRLELIVVDDASTDGGSAVVAQWLDSFLASSDHPFQRVLLLRHGCNSGLAAARNTAFSCTQAPWSFVLDSDNELFPNALASCLAQANAGGPQLAVVHPLLAVEVEPGRLDDQRTLVSSASWQRERLLSGNVVDAMALVRCSAWEAVGGYTHIEGGWEDFDFWCKLVGAGYHGVQCPQVLAVYRSHVDSMSHTATNRSWYALSRTLQKRHPWLQLQLAQVEWG